MTDRQLILEIVSNMPETASLAEILNELRLLKSVTQGLAETNRGQVTPHEEVVQKLETWIPKTPFHTSTAEQKAARRSDALKKLAASNAFSSIGDPEAWQRELRIDRELPR